MCNHEGLTECPQPEWKQDVGGGGFLSFLALLFVALLPALFFISPGLVWLLLKTVPALAGVGLIWAVVDVGRGRRIAWWGVVLGSVALLAWYVARQFFGFSD